jgi:SAM-dependent methyltransferase
MTPPRDIPPWEQAFAARRLSLADNLILKLSAKFRWQVRDRLARHLLVGDGVEIGAQYAPTKVDPGKARVEYVDAVTNEHLVERYGLGDRPLVPLTHVVEGVELTPYADGARDFLIAHHVLEHIDDPVGALVEWLRVLKDGGVLFLSVPNYRGNWFDFRRTPPDKAHLALDHADAAGREALNLQHYRDMAQSMWQWPDGDPRIEAQAQAWIEAGDRHHYHVWDAQALCDVLTLAAQAAGHPLRVERAMLLDHGFELLVAARKLPAGRPSVTWPSGFRSRLASLATLLRVAVETTLKLA